MFNSNTRKLSLESLEDRRLLSGDVGVEQDGANLVITGTDEREQVEVFYDNGGDTIRVNVFQYLSGSGWTQVKTRSFDADLIGLVRFDGGAGDDLFYNHTDIRGEAWGGAGNDQLFGGSGVDSLYGGDGEDVLFGNDGNDYLRGDAGDDYLKGKNGHDVIDAGTGDDYVNGGDGDDILMGAAGNDTLWGRDGNDALIGHAGNDRMYGQGGNDSLLGMEGDDWVVGGHGNDLLRGNSGNDTLLGNLGDDKLYGGDGMDYLNGQDGDDYLDGGADGYRDWLRGGPGADTFQHRSRIFSRYGIYSPGLFGSWADQVVDFNYYEGDRTV